MAPVKDEAKKYHRNLPGMGGIFNTVNMHLYHYAGIGQRSDSELQANNPVKYIDPDGRIIISTRIAPGNNFFQQNSTRHIANTNTLVSREGCYLAANTRVINAINFLAYLIDDSVKEIPAVGLDAMAGKNEFFDGDNLTTKSSGEMINKFTFFTTSTSRITGKNRMKNELIKYANSSFEHAAIVGKIKTNEGVHFVNIEGLNIDTDGNMTVGVYDTSNTNRTTLSLESLVAIEVTKIEF